MASSSENLDDVQPLSLHASHNDSANAKGTMVSSSESPDEVQLMWSRALGTGTSQNPTVISDDDDVVFVRQKRLRTPPIKHEPIKHESINKGDLSDEDLTLVAPLVNRIPRRSTEAKRKFSNDEQLDLIQSRSTSVAPPFAEWNSDGDDEFNITPSTLPVPSSSLPSRSIPG